MGGADPCVGPMGRGRKFSTPESGAIFKSKGRSQKAKAGAEKLLPFRQIQFCKQIFGGPTMWVLHRQVGWSEWIAGNIMLHLPPRPKCWHPNHPTTIAHACGRRASRHGSRPFRSARSGAAVFSDVAQSGLSRWMGGG